MFRSDSRVVADVSSIGRMGYRQRLSHRPEQAFWRMRLIAWAGAVLQACPCHGKLARRRGQACCWPCLGVPAALPKATDPGACNMVGVRLRLDRVGSKDQMRALNWHMR